MITRRTSRPFLPFGHHSDDGSIIVIRFSTKFWIKSKLIDGRHIEGVPYNYRVNVSPSPEAISGRPCTSFDKKKERKIM